MILGSNSPARKRLPQFPQDGIATDTIGGELSRAKIGRGLGITSETLLDLAGLDSLVLPVCVERQEVNCSGWAALSFILTFCDFLLFAGPLEQSRLVPVENVGKANVVQRSGPGWLRALFSIILAE